MSPNEFEHIIDTTRLRDRGRAVAYEVLVMGKELTAAAKAHGVVYETARRYVAAAQRAYRRAAGAPADWETITVTVPPSEAKQVRALEARAKQRAGL